MPTVLEVDNFVRHQAHASFRERQTGLVCQAPSHARGLEPSTCDLSEAEPPLHEVSVCDHADRVINKFSLNPEVSCVRFHVEVSVALDLSCVELPRHATGPYRGTSLSRKRPSSQDPPRTLGMGLQKGSRGVRFLSEVPM